MNKMKALGSNAELIEIMKKMEQNMREGERQPVKSLTAAKR